MKAKIFFTIILLITLSATAQQKNEFYVKPLSMEEYVRLDRQIDEFDLLESEGKYEDMVAMGHEVIEQLPFIEMGYFFTYYGGVLNKDYHVAEAGLDGMVDKYFFLKNVYRYIYDVLNEIKDNAFKKRIEKALFNFMQQREAFLESQMSHRVNLQDIFKELTWVNYQASDEAGFLRYLEKAMAADYGFINQFRNREEWKENRFKAFAQEHYQNLQKWGNTIEEKMKALLILSNAIYYENASLHYAPIFDWNCHVANFLPRIIASKTKQSFYEILCEMVGMVGENHTNVQFPSDIWKAHSDCGIEFHYGSGRFIVKNVVKEDLMDEIKPGDVVTDIGGIPVHEYIEANKDRFPFVSHYYLTSKPYKMGQIARQLLYGRRDSEVNVQFKKLSGETFSLDLVRDSYKLGSSGSGDSEKLVELEILDGSIWYFNIKRFYGGDIYQQFLDLIKNRDTAEAKGLIFDLRQNSGGNSGYGDRIFSHLIDQTAMRYAKGYHPVRIPLQEFRGYGRITMQKGGDPQKPNSNQKFDCPVVVLISPRTGSAAEDFTDLFQHNERGVLVGLPTGGGTGNGHQIYLPGGGSIRVCLNVDLGFSWVGIQPDHYVDFTPADIAQGLDPQLEKAIELLKIQ